MADAARETERLDADPLLLGTILADRYLRNTYRPTPPELTAWLVRFGDQPEAPAIRGLLERMAPELAAQGGATGFIPDRPGRGGRGAARPSQVRSLFVQNRDADAVAAARPLLSGATADQAGTEALFVAGLAAWRLGQNDTAHAFFDTAYHVASSTDQRAASAFWAGRVEQRRQDRGAFAVWMRRAALEGDSFYGRIARRALGPAVACLPGEIGNADVDALLATPQGRRAFALLQVGEKRYAEAELRTLWTDTAADGTFDRPLVLIARAAGLGQLAAEIEQNGASQDRRSDEAALPRLRPEGGFIVDPPLVYALVRHESNFRPVAVSRSGARGLMQLMPNTARAIAGAQAALLHDPAVNLSIGQRYLLVLAEDEAIDGNLIRLLAGYGQGQGGLRKWVDAIRDDGDPLLFLEAIPNGNTRVFIEEALGYSWHYAAMMHLPAASLDALAAGRTPLLVRAGEKHRRAGDGRAGACNRMAAAR